MLVNLRFRVYGWWHIAVMDLALAQCICAFEGCGRGCDLKFFLTCCTHAYYELYPPLHTHSQFASDAYVMQAHLCYVVSLLQCCAVVCLSHSRAVSEQSELLCCWCTSLLLSLLYCCLSSLKRLLYLWMRSLAWHHRLSSKSSIVYCELKRTKWGMYLNLYTSVVNPLRTEIHTYIQARPQTKAP